MAIELESHGAVHVGAVATRSWILQPLPGFHSGLAERVAEPKSAIRSPMKRESRPAKKRRPTRKCAARGGGCAPCPEHGLTCARELPRPLEP